MNKAQKLLQPLIEKMAKPIKVKLIGRGSHHVGFFDGLNAAQEALATLTDAITLADVPAVEWVGKETGYDRNWTTSQDNWWEVYDIDPGTPEHRCDAVNDDGVTNKSFATIEHAKRYVEIRIHLADLERKLLAELAGGK